MRFMAVSSVCREIVISPADAGAPRLSLGRDEMSRIVEEAASVSPARKRRDQEDRKRMQYRRAIEEFSERRRLQLEILDYPDLIAANYLRTSALQPRG